MSFTIKEGLTFDDVLLVPQHSNISSRSQIDVSVDLGKFHFSNPIIPANMQTVTGAEMAQAIVSNGGLAILHRFMPMTEQLEIAKSFDYINLRNDVGHMAASVGVKDSDKQNVTQFAEVGVRIICIDIAHGDSEQCLDMIRWIKENHPKMFIIAGNVATGNAAERLWRAGADAVKVGVGPGCWSAGTRILMSNGTYKNIEDVVPGDLIINMTGTPVKVLNAFCTGLRKVSRLKNNSFYTDSYVTPDHQFWVGDLSSISQKTFSSKGFSKILDQKSKTIPKQSKYKWKKISDAQDDALLFPRNIAFQMPENFSIHVGKMLLNSNYDLGYIFGTFLGDGTSTHKIYKSGPNYQIKWSFGLAENDIAIKLQHAISKCFDINASILEKTNILEVSMSNNELSNFLLDFGKREEKHLPENLFVSNKDYLAGLYDGLLDSDGHYEKDSRNSIKNTSSRIIELFNIITYILHNHLPNNSFDGKSSGGLKNCTAENLNDAYKARTLKSSERRLTHNFYVIKLLKYEECELEIPVYDITVDCDTHSFIANNMIVHNSLCTTRIETGNGVPQLTALMEVSERRDHLINDFVVYGEQPTSDRSEFTEVKSPMYIIADGGIKNAGDCVKALCFSDMVMIGNMFAGCVETPGQVIGIDGHTFKNYVGSSTHKTNHIEGVAALVPTKGRFKDVLTKLLEGLKSGCSYQGAHSIKELQYDPEFTRITNAGLKESHPHDVLVT